MMLLGSNSTFPRQVNRLSRSKQTKSNEIVSLLIFIHLIKQIEYLKISQI